MAEITSSTFNPDDFQRLLNPQSQTPASAAPQTGRFHQQEPLQLADDMETPLEPEISQPEPPVSPSIDEPLTLPEDDTPLDPGSDEVDENLQLLASLDKEKLHKLLALVEPEEQPSPVEDTPAEVVEEDDITPTMHGWRGLLAKWGLPVSPTQQEIEDAMWVREIQAPLDSPVRIGSTSFKGGCGKTTAAMMIATTLAKYNPHKKVIVVDLDPTGNAAFRAKDPQTADAQSYARALHAQPGMVDPSPYVTSTLEGVDILGARMDVSTPSLKDTDVKAILQAVSQWYDYVIVDMQYFNDNDPAYPQALEMLDAVVFLYEAKPDAVTSLGYMDTLLANSTLHHKRVVAFNHAKPEAQHERFDLREVATELIEQGAEVVELPYVDALYWGGTLDADDIAAKKIRPFVQLTATVKYLLRQS